MEELLILSAAHLNEELAPDQPTRFPQDDKIIKNLLGDDYQGWQKPQEIARGNGKIFYFPTHSYPAEKSLRKAYEGVMKSEGLKSTIIQHDKGWITPDENLSFTAWDEDQRRTLYLLNIDWKSNENSAKAKFHLKQHSFDLSIENHQLQLIHIKYDLAILPHANTTDIFSIDSSGDSWTIKVQTTGEDSLQLFNGHTGVSSNKTISSAGVHVIKVVR